MRPMAAQRASTPRSEALNKWASSFGKGVLDRVEIGTVGR